MSPIAPARSALNEAEKQNLELGHENLGFLSAEYGVMPKIPPLLTLPKSHQAWDDVIALLPALYKRVSIRQVLEELPLLSGGVDALPDRYLYRANTLLGVLAQAYYRGQFGLPEKIPAAILTPLTEVSARLGRPYPGLTFGDVTICNWKFKDPTKTERIVENLSLLFNVFSLPEDENFNLIITELHAMAAPLILSLVKAQEAILSEDDRKLQEELFLMIEVLKKLITSFGKIELPKYAARSFNPIVWAKTTGCFTLPTGDASPRLSGSATYLVHLLDAFLGRKQYNSKLGIVEKRLIYLVDAPHLKNFLHAIEMAPLNDYVERKNNPELFGTMMYFMEVYSGRRGLVSMHRQKVFGFLESAMKMGVSMTPGGFEARDVFLQRSWHKINDRLKLAEKEHLQSVPCRYPLVARTIPSTEESKNILFPMIKFDLSHSGLKYTSGDYLNIFVMNDDKMVNDLLSLFEVQRDHKIFLTTFWRVWLKRFIEYRDVEESIPIEQFFRLAQLYPMKKKDLQTLYTITKVNKINALLQENNYAKWNLIDILKMIKEESLYNINRFIYAEAWLPENISKWLTHAPFRHAVSFEDKNQVCSMIPSEGAFNRLSHIDLSQEKFYLSLEPVRYFNLFDKKGPLIIFAADEGLTAFMSIIEKVVSGQHSGPLYLFVVLSDFFNEERIKNIKQKLSHPKLKTTLVEKRTSADTMTSYWVRGMKDKKVDALLWRLMRSKLDDGEEGSLFVCGQAWFTKTVFNFLDEIVHAHYNGEEHGVGAADFLACMRAKHRYEISVMPSLLKDHNVDPLISVSDVVLHNNAENGYWIIINGSVYDITKFINMHLGGPIILTNQAGLDATAEYEATEHHKNELIQSMLSMYKIGRVREFHFDRAWGVAPLDGHYIVMTVKDFWQLWTKKLYLLVEMENALHNMFGYYPAMAAAWKDADSDLIFYKMQATADCHNTFLHTYLNEILNQLPNLWAVTASMCSLKEDLFFLQQVYDELQEQDAYEQSTHITVLLVDRIQDLLNKKMDMVLCHQQYNALLDTLLMTDKKLISDLKLALRQGLIIFETHNAEVLEKGQKSLLACLSDSVGLLQRYCVDMQQVYQQLVAIRKLS